MTRERLRNGGTLVALCLLVCWAAPTALRDRSAALDPYLIDLRAFYCAGSAANAGANPYLFGPMHDCEAGLTSNPARFDPDFVTPAPIPGYAIGVFRMLALAPFPAVAAIVFFGITLSFCGIVVIVQRLTLLPLPAVAAAFAVSGVLLHALELGQIVPFAVLGLTGAAWYLRRGDPWRTAACLGLLALQPQLAAGAMAAVLIFAPRMRLAVSVLAGALALASIAALPLSTNLQYFTSVLPAHVRSEMLNEEQFGVPMLLVSLGIAAPVALALAPWISLAALAAGIAAGGLLARRLSDPIHLVLVPPVFALAGAPFVHVHQFAAAMPSALAAYAALPGARRFLGPAVVLLAVPWIDFIWGSPLLLLIPACITAVLAWYFIRRTLFTAGAAALILTGVLFLIQAPRAPGAAATLSATPAADRNALAEVSWEQHVDLVFRNDPRRNEYAKSLSRAGLGGLLAVLAWTALFRREVASR